MNLYFNLYVYTSISIAKIRSKQRDSSIQIVHGPTSLYLLQSNKRFFVDSVTRFVKIMRLWQNLKVSENFNEGLFRIWPTFDVLAFFMPLGKFSLF